MHGLGAASIAVRSDECLQAHAIAEDERTDAMRAAHLVGGKDKCIDAERLEIDGHAAWRLYRIDVHDRAGFARERGDLSDRLHYTRLVARRHHADQYALGPLP